MAEPAVVAAVRGFKAGLLAEEKAQMREMARRWLEVERALEGQIAALVQEIDALTRAGKPINIGKLYRLSRWRKLLDQAGQEFERYARYADGLITERQLSLGQLGVEHAYAAIDLAGDGMDMRFARMSPDAVEMMVGELAGKAGDGGPLGDLLRRRMVKDGAQVLPGAFERLSTTLVSSAAQGWNPRKTARLMQDDLSAGLNKALQIARTEQLRVYRTAQATQYRDSGVVSGIQRLCAHDGRVCAACLADEGRVYPADAMIPDHVQGRCGQVPVLIGDEPREWLAGEEWLLTQDPDVQRGILGAGRYDLWQAGQLDFQDIVRHTEHPTWGANIGVRPLQEMAKGP